ncbi:MAG: EF-hand domain-containing protein [Burkholderiaceae bacterium]|nr:EF-hand domain-containing protein [Burkholderiaceae bacterium]
MTTSWIFALAAAGAGATLAWPAAAETAATGAPATAQAPLSKGEIKAMREFKLLDFNGDGQLSRTEVMLFPPLAAAFDEADTNHDNHVSYEEVRAFAAQYRAARERARTAAADTPASNTPR